MDNLWSHSLFFDNWLDVLVNVVVPSLTGDGGRFCGGVFGVVDGRCVLVLGCVTLKKAFNLIVLAMLKSLVFSGQDLVSVFLRARCTMLG